MDLNIISTVVAGVLTSLQSTSQANEQGSSSANGRSSTPESQVSIINFELSVIFYYHINYGWYNI